MPRFSIDRTGAARNAQSSVTVHRLEPHRAIPCRVSHNLWYKRGTCSSVQNKNVLHALFADIFCESQFWVALWNRDCTLLTSACCPVKQVGYGYNSKILSHTIWCIVYTIQCIAFQSKASTFLYVIVWITTSGRTLQNCDHRRPSDRNLKWLNLLSVASEIKFVAINR